MNPRAAADGRRGSRPVQRVSGIGALGKENAARPPLGSLQDITNVTNLPLEANGASIKLGKPPEGTRAAQVFAAPARPRTSSVAAAPAVPERSHYDPQPQQVSEYVPQIVALLFQEETASMPLPSYMEMQTDINGKMRSILVDWLVEVHMKYRLRHETLFLAVNLIDRYLAVPPVTRRRLQLVGVVAMFLAAKFEEIDPPRVKDFVYITDSSYTKEDILTLECTMLAAIGFNIVVPTATHFLHYLQKANHCDSAHSELASYLLELSLVDLRMIRHAPSRLVSAALMLSNELLGRPIAWPAAMALQSRHEEQALRGCAEELRAHLHAAPDSSLQAVRKKYLLPQHHSVASSPQAAAA